MKPIVLSGLVLGATLSSALHLPMQRVQTRGTSGSTPMSKSSGGSSLKNLENNLYAAKFTVGGSSFTLALDTGSSDLWFAPGKNNAAFANSKIIEPKLTLNLSYGTGSVVGDVAQLHSLSFAGFNIANQSYLSVTNQDTFFQNFESEQPDFQGLAGLSFDTLSDINNAVLNATNDTWGRSLMSNIFLTDPSTPNHIAFFLDRTGDLNDTDTGCFDIGTYAPGYEAVANEQKHEVYSGFDNGVLQWNMLLTGLKINGKDQKLKSGVKVDKTQGLTNVPPAGSISVLFDTGTSAAQIPAEAYKTLYESMGGVLINGSSLYAVPCLAEAAVEFIYGSQSVSIDPLDVTQVNTGTFGSQNFTYCTSAYEAGKWEGGDNDAILGDAFLRNVYAVYNYGDFVKTESGFKTNSPFIQFLPLTNATAASADFKKARAQALASLPPEIDVKTINDPHPKPASNSSSGSTLGSSLDASNLGSTDSSDDPAAELKSLSTLVPIMLGLLGACAGLLVILIAVVAAVFARIKKSGVPIQGHAYVPVALERERVGGYKDEPHAKYDSQFKD
ncbi:aspartyl protease [Ceratobasidium sp. AG-Ba]|nr:aspartyl protease [Ceratobasidium sp. AG-Ba]QRW12935.1 aspartyl protease [Ceratobasidium sp. AG-Ba]